MRVFGTSFCFFLYLWNHFDCELSLFPLITAPSPGLYHFFSKCEILPWNPSSHNSPWAWPGGLCNFCGLLQRKQEREPEPRFLQCAACVQEGTCWAASLGCLLLCAPASKAEDIRSAHGGLGALSIHQASGGLPSCWRPAGTGQERSSGTAWGAGEGFFFFREVMWTIAMLPPPRPPAPKWMNSELQPKFIHKFIQLQPCVRC